MRLQCFLKLIISISFVMVTASRRDGNSDLYVVHMDRSTAPSPFSSHHEWHVSTLSSLPPPNETTSLASAHVYSYNHVLCGFSAVLSRNQVEALKKHPGHVATYPNSFARPHTTYTTRFLGLSEGKGLWPRTNFGDGMIIGVVDSGVWPESPSFNDEGMSPVPSRWKGSCETGVEFNSSNCNRKLIGARTLGQGMKQFGINVSAAYDYDSPRDYWGHGTHTASTAVGRPIPDASYFGYAKGTAKGIAPLARLAIYKVLFVNITLEAASVDILAAIDQAVSDGVDVISISLGFLGHPFDQNAVAIGAFAAMERGISVVCSGGNRGPGAYTVQNGAPWITTVGGGIMDREYVAEIILRGTANDSITVMGKSIYPESLFLSGVPLYFGRGNRSKEVCEPDTLNPDDVKGTIIFCDFFSNETLVNTYEVTRTGAAGAIFSTDFALSLRPEDFDVPYVAVTPQEGDKIRHYIMMSNEPVATIRFQITTYGTKPAPQVMGFSARGPHIRSPWILKPDIIAPGVDILAAWVPNVPAAVLEDRTLVSDFQLQSGTSMAAPLVAGVTLLIKEAHPDWSPAAIRSAMMTTAYTADNVRESILDVWTGQAATPLELGAGHIDPEKAMDPGLVYDLKPEDYINYLCGMNYTDRQISAVTGRSRSNFSCKAATLDINYPSFIVILNNTNTTTNTFRRVLTSVTDHHSEYMVKVWTGEGMKVTVQPTRLSFSGKNSKAEFEMTVAVDVSGNPPRTDSDYLGNHGYIVWEEINGTHAVRSPVVSAYAIDYARILGYSDPGN
ncbi:hypothetical protein MLD38_032290 [Melastoma candidum]|uniref:Uncharacterized protein n=1 Tax=Melastoma candidum TaxID=119954 RepID=A0ACB9M510_9MYRT|nr:hypothetical protein MLD38_032290 [Melastoma candidum]